MAGLRPYAEVDRGNADDRCQSLPYLGRTATPTRGCGKHVGCSLGNARIEVTKVGESGGYLLIVNETAELAQGFLKESVAKYLLRTTAYSDAVTLLSTKRHNTPKDEEA